MPLKQSPKVHKCKRKDFKSVVETVLGNKDVKALQSYTFEFEETDMKSKIKDKMKRKFKYNERPKIK